MITPQQFAKAVEKKKRKERFQSKLIDPRNAGYGNGLLQTRRQFSLQMFRRVAEKAWLINTIIGHIIDKTMPYLRPLSAKGRRGFDIELKDPNEKMNEKDKKQSREIIEFLLKTGWDDSAQHEDDLVHYVKKILRDVLTLDQVASEKLWSNGGKLLAFEAIDAGTIVRCDERGYDGDDKIRYVQMINSQVVTQYQQYQMLFQFQNPRTDVRHSLYGYSKVEQCIDLVISLINSFNYNSGAFTEDKLPRGMLLLNGDADFEAVEEIEDYLIDVMGPSGINGAIGKWGIPIIPSGMSGDKGSITWQPMGSSNKDMEYSRWQDTLYMSIGAVYGVDIESMGIKSEKGAKIMESGSMQAKRYSDDKGIGNCLTFLERHLQHYVNIIDPRFTIVFHGFEQDDAKETREENSSKLASYFSLNDMLRENDKPESKEPWADIPGLQNPQYLQAWQGSQTGGEEDNPEDQQDQGKDDFDFGKSIPEEVVRIKI